VLLGVVAQPQAVPGDHLAAVRLLLAGEQLEQGGLARAVEPSTTTRLPLSIARSTPAKISSEP